MHHSTCCYLALHGALPTLLHSLLPFEHVCNEKLTPFLKLVCKHGPARAVDARRRRGAFGAVPVRYNQAWSGRSPRSSTAQSCAAALNPCVLALPQSCHHLHPTAATRPTSSLPAKFAHSPASGESTPLPPCSKPTRAGPAAILPLPVPDNSHTSCLALVPTHPICPLPGCRANPSMPTSAPLQTHAYWPCPATTHTRLRPHVPPGV
ncbi:hypothetical protein B0H10DRAFT_1188956 [Mycena sp. CBHHK59/15]|nr:hypothetical protein B0H10DRAFT_1188956 [Mycena sp. CBHHK59/15]